MLTGRRQSGARPIGRARSVESGRGNARRAGRTRREPRHPARRTLRPALPAVLLRTRRGSKTGRQSPAGPLR